MNTPAVLIEVTSEFLQDQSNPEQSLFAFAYHITITNQSDETIQLINRKWIITDANGIVNEVEGKGVIGEQPFIMPLQSYSYSSCAILKTPVGCMHGHYGMRNEDGDKFSAAIPVFTLAVPGLVN
jgi:ApaG protein